MPSASSTGRQSRCELFNPYNRSQNREQSFTNVHILSTFIFPPVSLLTSVLLPAESIDLMLLVDVYHEFSFPYEMGTSMYNALKPNGKIVLVEFRMEDDAVPIKTIHKMSESQAIKEMKKAGFRLEKNYTNLPWQHCMVFVK